MRRSVPPGSGFGPPPLARTALLWVPPPVTGTGGTPDATGTGGATALPMVDPLPEPPARGSPGRRLSCEQPPRNTRRQGDKETRRQGDRERRERRLLVSLSPGLAISCLAIAILTCFSRPIRL